MELLREAERERHREGEGKGEGERHGRKGGRDSGRAVRICFRSLRMAHMWTMCRTTFSSQNLSD